MKVKQMEDILIMRKIFSTIIIAIIFQLFHYYTSNNINNNNAYNTPKNTVTTVTSTTQTTNTQKGSNNTTTNNSQSQQHKYNIVQIYGTSMKPTLLNGEIYEFIEKKYNVEEIKYNDIIFFVDEENVKCIKRVIGLPGDIIEHRHNGTFRNNQKIDEYYLTENNKNFINLKVAKQSLVKVAENSIYVLGDNRSKSFDSRFYKNHNVHIKNIIGKLPNTTPKLDFNDLNKEELEHRDKQRKLRQIS